MLDRRHAEQAAVEDRFGAGQARRADHPHAGRRAHAAPPAAGTTPLGGEATARAGAAAIVQRRAGFTDVLAALEQALASRRPDLTEPGIPPEVAGTLQGRRAVLLGFTTAESDRAERVLRSAGVAVRSLARSADPRADLDADEVVLVSADALPDELHHPGPVLAVGSPEGLCAAVPRGVRNLLTRPWRSEALLLRVYLAVRDAEPGGCRAVAVGEPPRNIVVADDDETITALLAATLRHGGYRCHVAHDGHQALELIERVRPGAAVLDVNMPRKDGFEVLAALQNGGRSRMLPVVLLTARRQELDVLRGFELGAADYVVKPFNPLELAARLKRLAPVR